MGHEMEGVFIPPRFPSCMYRIRQVIFKSNNRIWTTGALSSFSSQSSATFMYVISLAEYDSAGGGRAERVCMWRSVGTMALTLNTVTFHTFIHVLSFKVCQKGGGGGRCKVHKGGVTFSKNYSKTE
jgi:hypothetical protein